MTLVLQERSLLCIDQDAKPTYSDWVTFFLNPEITATHKTAQAGKFLQAQLNDLKRDEIEFPATLSKIKPWFAQQHQQQCLAYQQYRKRRQSGQGREYFRHISDAFEFLIKVAPVKRVDGAWLYSTVQYWNNPLFSELIQIYLEELGLGLMHANHVCVYDDLLLNLGLQHAPADLESTYNQQPAIQLALAYAPIDYLPEIIGFNLGYEQLPLHLLISNYELKELGINSQYFNLHITIDNIDNGHADLAIKAVNKIAAHYPDQAQFMAKLKAGFALNDLGLSSRQIIENLNVEAMVLTIMKRKGLVAHLIHNDHCQFKGQTINEWLSSPEGVEAFIGVLIEKKWINLNQPVENSRFWHLISHEKGKMYGVFNSVEKQMIYDWICGVDGDRKTEKYAAPSGPKADMVESILDFNQTQLQQLKKQLIKQPTHSARVDHLIPYLSPHLHHQFLGLWATQQFIQNTYPYLAKQYVK